MFRKLAVLGENVWIADGIVFKSTNFCETWKIPDLMQSVSGSAINFINKDTGFAGGGSNRLYKTVNGGYNWIRQRTDSLSFAFISSIDFVNDSVGWYSCGAGRIYKTTTGGQILTKIITTTTEIPVKYILYQNYPNPFNPITTISYEINKTAFVEIELFNVSGSKISFIEKRNRLPGYYPIKLRGENLVSGLYFYNLKIDGKVIDVKKLVILK